jgi:hypothetical protein
MNEKGEQQGSSALLKMGQMDRTLPEASVIDYDWPMLSVCR